MKSTLRILCAALAVLMLCLTLAACQNNSSEPAATDSGDSATQEKAPALGFSAEDNNGAVISVLMPIEKEYEIATKENSDKDRVSAAMYRRNAAVEDYLGVVFDIKTASGSWSNRNDYNQKIANNVKVAKEYDIVTGQASCTFVPCAQEGYFMDFNSVETFDFTSDWWVKDMNQNYAIDGRLYGVVGDLSLSLYRSMAVLYFNQYLIEQYQMESPYDMVRKGTWTLSNMMEMAKQVEESVDGPYDRATNMMGFMPYFKINRNFLCALDIPLVERNAETGEVTIPHTPNEKLVDAFDYLYELFENENTVYCCGDTVCFTYFVNNTVLITGGSFDDVEKIRNMSENYGIVPLPKYDTLQENYLSAIDQSTLMWHLPSNASNTELLAKVMEALSFYGLYDVTPEYYEIALGLTYARDENVMEMLSIIRKNAVMRWESIYDMAFTPSLWNIIQMTDAYRHPAANKVGTYHGNNVTTFWATNQEKWQAGIDALCEKLSSLEN